MNKWVLGNELLVQTTEVCVLASKKYRKYLDGATTQVTDVEMLRGVHGGTETASELERQSSRTGNLNLFCC